MLYCEICRVGIEKADICPICGSTGIREIRDNDPVFLWASGPPWNGVAEDILEDNDIPFLRTYKQQGLHFTDASRLFCRYYVPFGALKKAKGLIANLLDDENLE